MCMCVVVCAVKLDTKKKGFLSSLFKRGKTSASAAILYEHGPSRPPTAAGSTLVCVCVHTDRCCRTTQQTPPLISLL